jgi:hypothetical protein
MTTEVPNEKCKNFDNCKNFINNENEVECDSCKLDNLIDSQEETDCVYVQDDDLITCPDCNNVWDGNAQCQCLDYK